MRNKRQRIKASLADAKPIAAETKKEEAAILFETAAKHKREAAQHLEDGEHDKAFKSVEIAQNIEEIASESQKDDAQNDILKGI